MKYKAGDKVRIKSREWWDAQPKNESGSIDCGTDTFNDRMASMCGKVVEISDVEEKTYFIKEFEYNWTDEMFEGLVSGEKTLISTELIKDIAEVIKTHNLGVSISENEGKLIIEPLKVEEDLPKGTIVVFGNDLDRWFIGSYRGNKEVLCTLSDKARVVEEGYKYIIEFSKFNPNNIEESLKFNIVK